MDVAFDFVGKDNDGLGYGLYRSMNLCVHGRDILRDIFGHNSLQENSLCRAAEQSCRAAEWSMRGESGGRKVRWGDRALLSGFG
ncbi:hypothetical protein Tco_1370937 [Tanacetum coccineum]